MIRSTLAVAALLASLSLADTAKAQFSLSLGNGSGKSFNLAIGGGQPRGFGHRGPIRQVGGWTPIHQGGGHFHGGYGVQPVGYYQSGWQPAVPVSRVLHSSNGQVHVVGMPTRGGGFSQPSFGGTTSVTHVRRDHAGTHTTIRTRHANGTTSIQRSAVGVPVQSFALAP